MIKYGHKRWDDPTRTNQGIADLQGKTLVAVERRNDDEIIFVTSEGEGYLMYHSQDCCEQVYIEDVVGDFSDLIGTPLLVAEERTNRDLPPAYEHAESYTWTYYTFRTIKGSVDIRWYGESNGYYSESATIENVRVTDFKPSVPDNFNDDGEE